jgi:hypothetical protein
MPKADQRKRGKQLAAKATFDEDVDALWHRYRQQPIECAVCGKKFIPRPASAKTCGDPECKREYDRRYERECYNRNPEIREKKIAQGIASRKRRHKPIVKRCIAPHPTIPGALCGKEFVAKGRDLTCSPECGVRRRWALQRGRYHANPQAKQDFKNQFYADHYAHELVTKRCPYCGREFKTKKHNQQTCGRPYCIQRIYETTARKEINAAKRKKRRENPGVDAAYQRNYGIANPEKIKGYRAKRRAKKLEKLDRIDRDKLNRGLRTNNTSGYTGVSRMRTKWCANITINGKHKYLGDFATKEAAAAAYRKAAEEARLKTPLA